MTTWDVQVVFEGVRGNGPYGDMAIDDIGFTNSRCVGEQISSFTDILSPGNVTANDNIGFTKLRCVIEQSPFVEMLAHEMLLLNKCMIC